MAGSRTLRRRLIAALVLAAATTAPTFASSHTAPATASMSAADVWLLGGDRDSSDDPGTYVGTGLPGAFRFFDGDLPFGLSATAVRVHSSADPVGIVLLAHRAARNDATYLTPWFNFSTVASNQVTGTLKVSHGGTVTATYLDATNDNGVPERVEKVGTWHRGSAMPDPRELVFSTANPASPTVHGAWRSVAPGAIVKAYATASGGSPIGTTTADTTGAFTLATTPQTPTLDEIYVTATEAGEAESARRAVERARVTGRVVLPEPQRHPVLSAFSWVRPVGTANPCHGVQGACTPGGHITDHSGRWGTPGSYLSGIGYGGGPGPYDVDIHHQGFNSDAIDEPWKSGAYGNPPTVRTTIVDPNVTADAGEIALLPPNFVGTAIASGGFGLEDVVISVLSPGGSYLPGGGNTRADGKFALRLPDGDFRLRLLPPAGCEGYRSIDTDIIRVRNGAADPSSATYDMGAGALVARDPVSVPVNAVAPVQVEVGVPGSTVGVTLQGANGAGSIVTSCAPAGVPVNITPVGAPVDVHVPGLSFASADVCMTHAAEDLARAGVSASDVDLFHVLPSGAVERITGRRDSARGKVCGATSSFSTFLLGVQRGPLPTGANRGYWMVTSAGQVYTFGNGPYLGNAPVGAAQAVDIEATPTGNGYWIVDDAGHVFAFGDAPYLGGMPSLGAGERVTSLSRTPSGRGYWLFTTTGRVTTFGDASWYGDMRATRLNGPVLDSIPTASGRGYYMVASDGGIFTFGDARFLGSMGNTRLNAPVQSLVPDPDGTGYWLVASDGGIFTFEAPFRGSMGSVRLNRPVTGMVGAVGGYLMVAEDGGIFTFGNAPFHGSLGNNPPPSPVTSVSAF